MNLKTEYRYNEDDFYQHGGNLNELTVTITLGEYRNLISEQTRLVMELERVQEEKAELEKQLKAVTETLAVCKLPEWMRATGNALVHWGEDQGGAEQEAEDAE